MSQSVVINRPINKAIIDGPIPPPHPSSLAPLSSDNSSLTTFLHPVSIKSEPTEQPFKIPNIVHYIWYNPKSEPIRFHHLLSIMSADKVLHPDRIMFHTDNPPVGDYWQQALQIENFQVVYRDPPTHLFGEVVKKPMFYTSHSNVDRVKILQEYGGIYLDLDTFITSSLDELRKQHSCVIGQEQEHKACGSFIACNKYSLFLILWLNSYLDDYRMDQWAYNTGTVPFNLAKRYPNLVYMDPDRINRPNFKGIAKIWGPERFDWRHNYAVHILYRIWKDKTDFYEGIEPDPKTIRTMNTTFGEMARWIYYDNPTLLKT